MDSSKYDLSSNWWDKHQIFVPAADDDLGKIAYQNVLRLKFRILKQLASQALKQIQTAANEAQQLEMMRVYQELKAQENTLAKELGVTYS